MARTTQIPETAGDTPGPDLYLPPCTPMARDSIGVPVIECSVCHRTEQRMWRHERITYCGEHVRQHLEAAAS